MKGVASVTKREAKTHVEEEKTSAQSAPQEIEEVDASFRAMDPSLQATSDENDGAIRQQCNKNSTVKNGNRESQ